MVMQVHHSIVEAASAVRRGDATPTALVRTCLERIEHFEPQVHAWVAVDRSGALAAAEQAERERASGLDRGPLHGIPIGVKDIVDVQGLPTRAGSLLTSAEPAPADAPVVARLRSAGAIILGKTVTTEFACFDPSPTRNPWNVDHTPGGSSSGSAAAVASGMVLGAIGTQTGGSITRPASYCGIAGCKPTFGRTSRAGVTPVSFHLDHVGAMARTAVDCALMLSAMAGDDPSDPACAPRPPFACDAAAPVTAPRLGVIHSYFFDETDAETAALTREAIDKLAGQGATIVELPLPNGWHDVHAMHRRIYFAEAAEVHRRTYGAPAPGTAPRWPSYSPKDSRSRAPATKAPCNIKWAFATRWPGCWPTSTRSSRPPRPAPRRPVWQQLAIPASTPPGATPAHPPSRSRSR